MNLDALRAKDAAALTDEEKSFLTEHRAELTADEQTKFGVAEESEKDDKPQGPATPNNPAQPETPAKPAEPTPAPAEVTASNKDGSVTISASQFAALESRANAGMEAKIELDRMRNAEEAKAFTFSASNQDGVFLPKSAGKLETFLFSLSATQKTAFKELVNEMPKGLTKMFGEVGDGGDSDAGDPSDKLNALAQAKVEEAKKVNPNATLTFSQALRDVSAAHPELTNDAYTIQGAN